MEVGLGRNGTISRWLVAVAACTGALTWPAESPCSGAPYRQFDFWVGEWRVTGADGELAGHNAITTEQDGCLLVENWRSAQGRTGTSLNFYDPVAEQWRQVWVSPGTRIDIRGGLVDGSMVLEGTIVYVGQDVSRPFRGTWTPLDDGRVRQFFEEFAAAGSWTPWFEGYYARTD